MTHDLDLALRHGGVMWLVAYGKLGARGSPAEGVESPATREAFEVEMHVGTRPAGRPLTVPSWPGSLSIGTGGGDNP